MERTEKTKRMLSAAVIILLALALVSMFFVISTMARYATSGTGTGTVGVAEWDVKFGNGTTAIDFGTLSPNMNAMDAAAPQALTNSHSGTISITNNGDVDAIATVDLTIKDVKFTLTNGAAFNTGDVDVYTKNSGITNTKSAPRQSEVERMFAMQFKPNSLEGIANTEKNFVSNGNICHIRVPAATTAAGTTKPTVVKIGVDLIWTTDYVNLGEVADHLDTWVGENVSKIEWGIAFNIVQGSELPSGGKADLPVIPPEVDPFVIDATGMDAAALQAAVAEKVSKGFTEIKIINMAAEPDFAMFTAIRQGLDTANGRSIDLTIEDVTTIPTNSGNMQLGAFAYNTRLKSINLPDATTIGMFAFAGCTSLKTIDLPKATTIGNYAFVDCTSLTTIDLPAATTIGKYAFDRCESLEILKLTTAAETIVFDGTPFIVPKSTEITLYLNANKKDSVTGDKKDTFNGIQFKAIYCGEDLVTTVA